MVGGISSRATNKFGDPMLVFMALITAPVCAAEINGIVTEVHDGDSVTPVTWQEA